LPPPGPREVKTVKYVFAYGGEGGRGGRL